MEKRGSKTSSADKTRNISLPVPSVPAVVRFDVHARLRDQDVA